MYIHVHVSNIFLRSVKGEKIYTLYLHIYHTFRCCFGFLDLNTCFTCVTKVTIILLMRGTCKGIIGVAVVARID